MMAGVEDWLNKDSLTLWSKRTGTCHHSSLNFTVHGSRFTIHDLRFYTLCCYYFPIQYFPLRTALSNYVVCVPIILIAHRKLTFSYPSSVFNEFPSRALEGSRARCDGQLSRSHYKVHRLGFGYWSNRRYD